MKIKISFTNTFRRFLILALRILGQYKDFPLELIEYVKELQ